MPTPIKASPSTSSNGMNELLGLSPVTGSVEGGGTPAPPMFDVTLVGTAVAVSTTTTGTDVFVGTAVAPDETAVAVGVADGTAVATLQVTVKVPGLVRLRVTVPLFVVMVTVPPLMTNVAVETLPPKPALSV